MNTEKLVYDLTDVRVTYGDTDILNINSFAIAHGERWAIIGPNGAGKSTLIKVLAGLLPSTGKILLCNVPVSSYAPKSRAQTMAYVPQTMENRVPYTVFDYVMLGRYCRMDLWGATTQKDKDTVLEAMDICDVAYLSDRYVDTLSGGEKQRVVLAGAVAQESSVLLLDEPTAYLDPAHEAHFFSALNRLHQKRSMTSVMVTHDINNAIMQCSHIAVLNRGGVIFSGSSEKYNSLCPSALSEAFSVNFKCFGENGFAGNKIFGTWDSGKSQ